MEPICATKLAPSSPRILAPVLATPAQILPTADPRDLREWEANEIGAPADERFTAEASR